MSYPGTQLIPTRTSDRRAFTLLEALMGVTVLSIVVIAVVAAITASQRVAFEGQKRILAAMAADDMMSELLTLSYDDIRAKDGTVQPIGEMTTLDSQQYPETFWALGRSISVQNTTLYEETLDVSVDGITVTVTVLDEGAMLAQAEIFVPEPQS